MTPSLASIKMSSFIIFGMVFEYAGLVVTQVSSGVCPTPWIPMAWVCFTVYSGFVDSTILFIWVVLGIGDL